MLTKSGVAMLSRALDGLRQDDAAGWRALAPLSRLSADGMEISIDFSTEDLIGAPVIVARPRVAPALPESLTARQRDVALGLARGLSNKVIARELGVSPATVKDHVAAVLAAFGVSRRAEVAARLHGSMPRLP